MINLALGSDSDSKEILLTIRAAGNNANEASTSQAASFRFTQHLKAAIMQSPPRLVDTVNQELKIQIGRDNNVVLDANHTVTLTVKNASGALLNTISIAEDDLTAVDGESGVFTYVFDCPTDNEGESILGAESVRLIQMATSYIDYNEDTYGSGSPTQHTTNADVERQLYFYKQPSNFGTATGSINGISYGAGETKIEGGEFSLTGQHTMGGMTVKTVKIELLQGYQNSGGDAGTIALDPNVHTAGNRGLLSTNTYDTANSTITKTSGQNNFTISGEASPNKSSVANNNSLVAVAEMVRVLPLDLANPAGGGGLYAAVESSAFVFSLESRTVTGGALSAAVQKMGAPVVFPPSEPNVVLSSNGGVLEATWLNTGNHYMALMRVSYVVKSTQQDIDAGNQAFAAYFDVEPDAAATWASLHTPTLGAPGTSSLTMKSTLVPSANVVVSEDSVFIVLVHMNIGEGEAGSRQVRNILIQESAQ